MSGWFGPNRKKSPKVGLVSSGSLEQPGSPKLDLKLDGGGQGLHNPLAWDSVPSSLKEKFPHWKERSPLATEGNSISISEGTPSCSLFKSSASSRKQPKYTLPYVVMDSDTVNGIAIKFETTPTELARLNKKQLSNFTIFAGDVLYVPDQYELEKSIPKPAEPALPDTPTADMPTVTVTPPTSQPKSAPPSVSRSSPEHHIGSQDTIRSESLSNTLPEKGLSNGVGPTYGGVASEGKEDVQVEEKVEFQVFSPTSSASSIPPSIVDCAKDFEEEVTDTHIMLMSKYISEDQGCIHGNLVVNQTVMMFSPFRDDPMVKEHGPSMFEVVIPLQDIVFAAITTDVTPPTMKSTALPAPRKEDATDSSDMQQDRGGNKDNVDGTGHEQNGSGGSRMSGIGQDDVSEPEVLSMPSAMEVEVAGKDVEMVDGEWEVSNGAGGREEHVEEGQQNKEGGEQNEEGGEQNEEGGEQNEEGGEQNEEGGEQSEEGGEQNEEGGEQNEEGGEQNEDGEELQQQQQQQEEHRQAAQVRGDEEQLHVDNGKRMEDIVNGRISEELQDGEEEDEKLQDRTKKQQDRDKDEKQQDRDENGALQEGDGSQLEREKDSVLQQLKGSRQVKDGSNGAMEEEEEEEHMLSAGSDTGDVSDGPVSRIPSSQKTSECSVDSLLADKAYFLHVRVSSKSCAAYVYIPVNRPVGIDIPANNPFLPTRQSSIHQVKTTFCFAVAQKRIGDIVHFLYEHRPVEELPVPPSLGLVSSWVDGCYVILSCEETDPEDLLFSDDHFTGGHSTESWEVFSMQDIAKYRNRIDRMEVEQHLPLPVLSEQSCLMEERHLRALSNQLPSEAIGHDWVLVYSTFVHGISLRTLYRNMNDVETAVVLLVQDEYKKLFGAVVTCPLKLSEKFKGTGESFLFSFPSSDSEEETQSVESSGDGKMSIYHWTGENSYIVKGSPEGLYVGCGDGHTGLWLDDHLRFGTSQECSTFNNACLSTHEEFECMGLEAWAFLYA